MKWFRHQTDSYTNLKHREIMEEFGLEGYGFYWVCCELVGQQGEKYRLKNSKGWLKALKNTSNLSEEKINKFLNKFAFLNLISANALKDKELYIPKMRDYSDDYTKFLRRHSEETCPTTHNITLHKIILEYITLKGWSQEKNILTSVYKRNCKTAKSLFTLTNQNLERVIACLRWCGATFKNKGLPWTLETVENWYPEYNKQYPLLPDKSPQEFKDLVKKVINKESQ